MTLNVQSPEAQALAELLPQIYALADAKEAEENARKWRNIARANQLPPAGNWVHWLCICARAFGKTRMGSEFHKEEVLAGRATRGAIIAPTAADLRDVVVEGESGILAAWHRDPTIIEKPEYQKTNRCIKFPNGSMAFLYSAEEPERLRGPQHDFYWFDEAAAAPRHQEVWDMLQFGLRLGKYPRGVVTTTPRPFAFLKELRDNPYTAVTYGTTYDNRANLPPVFFDQIVKKFEGTRLGQQELMGVLLDETPDALWREDTLRNCYVEEAPALRRIVVIIDPSTSGAEDADEAGIIVAAEGMDAVGYLLWDGSLRGTPAEWARQAVRLYHEFEADGILAEKNQGGDMILGVLSAVEANVPVRLIHASKSKEVRAEPVAALYEQGRIKHVRKHNGKETDFRALEAQMLQMSVSLGYTGRGSPDRCDANVHGFNDLLILHAHGAIHFLPEFRAPKPDATGDAPHISRTELDAIPYWAHRWVSVSLGPISAAHWYAQDGDQARIYREMTWDSQSTEKIGSDIAQASETELAGAKMIQVWLDKQHFDAKLGNKNVAQSLSDGIERVLGAGAGFLGAFNEFERHIPDEARRIVEFKRREAAVKDRRMTVVPIDADPQAGWEHMRSLLRYEQKPALVWNKEYAAHLRDTDQVKYDLYLNTVTKAGQLEPPKLLIHDACPETIRALGSLSRDERNNDQPQLVGESGAVASSVNIGMLAHRVIQTREPLEQFMARRLESVRKRYEADGKTLGADILFQVEQKARADYGTNNVQPIDLRALPSRKRLA
jgi:phage terminase large subunit-like protein